MWGQIEGNIAKLRKLQFLKFYDIFWCSVHSVKSPHAWCNLTSHELNIISCKLSNESLKWNPSLLDVLLCRYTSIIFKLPYNQKSIWLISLSKEQFTVRYSFNLCIIFSVQKHVKGALSLPRGQNSGPFLPLYYLLLL